MLGLPPLLFWALIALLAWFAARKMGVIGAR